MGMITTTEATKKMEALFDELVPDEGPAKTVAGEIVRAVSRLEYRYYNDGDKIGCEYGNETCNSAARYLGNYNKLRNIIRTVWDGGSYNYVDDSYYEAFLAKLTEAAIDIIEEHPDFMTRDNWDDMLGYKEPSDSNYDEEEDEEEDED